MSETSPLESIATLPVTTPVLFGNFRERKTVRQKMRAVLRTIKRGMNRALPRRQVSP